MCGQNVTALIKKGTNNNVFEIHFSLTEFETFLCFVLFCFVLFF